MVSKDVLKEILLEHRTKAKRMDFVRREKLLKIMEFLKLKQSIIITGIRRCGKSTFLYEVMDEFFDNPYYINFEDERLADFALKDFNVLYETCVSLFGESRTFFADEIQNIAGWEMWVRRMGDDGFKFFITGSNARLLSKELATKLTGRHLQIELFPFSFREFLEFQKFDFKKEDIYITERRAILVKYLSEYIEKGGFPEYLKDNKIEILQEYFLDIVQRDICERYKVKKSRQLKQLAKYLVTNSGNLTTHNQLGKLTQLSVDSAINYVSYLEDAYLLIRVPYFSFSLRKQFANPFKVYAIDTGLRNAISFQFSKDIGRAYETIVAVELKRQGKEIYYWKNVRHEEVDFVINEREVSQIIQVCYDVNDINVKKRELTALIKAAKELKCKNLLVITSEYEGEEKFDGKTVKFIPLLKWLLN